MSRSIETVCLIALLAVVGLRPLIAERYDSATLDLTRALRVVEDAMPATTLIIDGVILLAAVGWLAARTLRQDRTYRWTGLEWGGALVLAAAALSCVFASNKRLAVNGAVDWLCCLLLAVTLAQLLCDRRRVRWALCVVVASGAAQAVECFHQVYYSFPETEAMYREQRETLWSGQGVPLDSQQVELFESRLRSREAFGYLSHSNVAGAHLVLCALAAAGMGWARWKGRKRAAGRPTSRQDDRRQMGVGAVAAWLVAAVILVAAATTGARGALAAGAIAVVLFLLRVRLDAVCRRHPRRAFLCGWSAVALIAVAVVGHGLFHGSLPGRSLDFRWKYWTASARMAADHPLTGVGSGNFGRHYLRYKTIDSPEEVKNPHNFLVSAATDWGMPGAIGLLMILYGATRSLCLPNGDARPRSDPDDVGRAETLGLGIALATAVFLPRVWLLGSDDPNHLYFETLMPLCAWAAAFGFLFVFPLGGATTLATCLSFAVFAFLLQDTINFATLIPGTLTTVCACFAIALAAGSVDIVPDKRHSICKPALTLGSTSVLFVLFCAWILTPVWRTGAALRAARRADNAASAVHFYDRAADLDPWDATALFESARLLFSQAAYGDGGADAVDRAIRRVERAIERDPIHVSLHRLASRCHTLRASRTGDPNDRNAAVAAAQRATALYPTDPESHTLLADCLADRGSATSNRDDLTRALEQYAEALHIDDARPAWEKIRRLRPARRDAIAARIDAMNTRLARLPDGR